MTETITVYKFITELSSTSSPDVQVGDLIVNYYHSIKSPTDWSIVPNNLLNFRLSKFKDKLPGIIFVNPSSVPERVTLEEYQKWQPKINCNSYCFKELISLKLDEIWYHWYDEKIWYESESFYEWIIFTKAELIKEDHTNT